MPSSRDPMTGAEVSDLYTVLRADENLKATDRAICLLIARKGDIPPVNVIDYAIRRTNLSPVKPWRIEQALTRLRDGGYLDRWTTSTDAGQATTA